MMKVSDAIILSILLYGSEVWEPYLNQTKIAWGNNAIEENHTQFIKRILGLNRSTTNHLPRGESGRYPLHAYSFLRIIKYTQEKIQVVWQDKHSIIKNNFLTLE